MELQLYDLFIEKHSIGRRVGRRWLERHAKIIYGNLYPDRVIQKEGQPTVYKGFSVLKQMVWRLQRAIQYCFTSK